MKTLTLAALAALLPMTAFADDGIHAEDAYARSTNPMVGAVFLRLENHRQVACTLQAVSTDAAERAELQTRTEEDGIMKMGRIEGGITIPAGATQDLNRGGDHIMLLGLTDPLADGDEVSLTLDFGDCGIEQATAVMDNARDPARAAMPMGDHANH